MKEFRFAPLRHEDLSLLAVWLAHPHVARWWRESPAPGEVARRYGPLIEGLDPTEGFIVHLSDRPIGYAQRYLIDEDPEWRASIREALGDSGGIGIDYLIGEADCVGRGIGRRMICEFSTACWERYGSGEHITVAVQQDNVASWRALEASGFRRVWTGNVESSDPSDRGPSFIYVANAAER